MDTLEWVVLCVLCLVVGVVIGEVRGERRVRAWRRLLNEVYGTVGGLHRELRPFVDETEAAFLRRVGKFRGGPN